MPQKAIDKRRKRSKILKKLSQPPLEFVTTSSVSPLAVDPLLVCSASLSDLTPATSSSSVAMWTLRDDVEGSALSDTSSDGYTSIPDEEEDYSPSARSRRKKRTKVLGRPVLLDEVVERDLGEWYRDHPILYNKSLREYKDVAKKTWLYEEKGRTMTPQLTG